ncbi:MAG: hypothetical protein QHI48_08150 [Bacteroidota bacterium]|nr:hypothetical protein [Bacteroidota bacterium]
MTIAGGDQKNPSVAMPSNEDFTIIVWQDGRGNDLDIYAQKIDNVTGIALWWPPDGVPVCTAENDQRNPRAAYDTLGGVIITWEDCREDPTNAMAGIYATRLLVTSGALSPGWQPDGDAICAGSWNCSRPRIAGNGEGAYIVWTDERQGSDNRDVYLQYILSDGRVAPGRWQAGGICVPANADPDQINGEVARDHAWQWNDDLSAYVCGAVVAYQDKRNVSSSNGEPCWN